MKQFFKKICANIFTANFQGFTLKRYPAQLSLATLANFIGAAQSAVFTSLVTRHQPVSWVSRSFVEIATVLFGVSKI